MKLLVTGGGGFIGSHLAAPTAARRATTCGSSTTSPPAAARTCSALGDDVELVEGDIQSYERVHNAVARLRGRLPPGGAAVGAALGAGPADQQRHERHRHAQRAARRARRGRAARRLRLVVVGLRRQPRAAEARGHAAAADLALRGLQARRRGLLPRLRRGLRPRDGGAALLQRLRPAPGPALAVRGGDPATSSPRCSTGERADDLRRRRAVARLHLRRQRRRGEPAARWTRRAWRARSSTSPAASGSRSTSCSTSCASCSTSDVEAEYVARPARRRAALAGRRRRAREALGYEPTVDLREGLRRTIERYRARRVPTQQVAPSR